MKESRNMAMNQQLFIAIMIAVIHRPGARGGMAAARIMVLDTIALSIVTVAAVCT
jgi:hypothetical protein